MRFSPLSNILINTDVKSKAKISDIYSKGNSITTRCGEVTRMLQSIQYVGSGPPTYIYSNKEVGASGEYYHVFAAETRGYDSRRERREKQTRVLDIKSDNENAEEEFRVVENKSHNLQEVYKKEYGRRESFLWKQK